MYLPVFPTMPLSIAALREKSPEGYLRCGQRRFEPPVLSFSKMIQSKSIRIVWFLCRPFWKCEGG